MAWGDVRRAAQAPAAPVERSRAVSGLVTVERPPVRIGHGSLRALVRADALPGLPAGARLLAEIPPGAGAGTPPAGARLRVSGRLAPAAGRAAPGWWVAHLARLGVSGRLRVDMGRTTGRRGGLAGLRDRWRTWVRARSGAGLAGDRRALVRGMTIGATDELSERAAGELRTTGLWHLVAVSGQNVAVVALAVMWLAGRAGARPRARLLGGAGAIVAYCVACDGGASVARAGVMGLVGLAARWRGSGRAPWHALAVGLAALACERPASLGDPGLQLSFAAVVGILALTGPLTRLAGGWVPRPLTQPLAVSLAAGLATAPVLVWHFGRLSLAGLALNLVAVPLAGPVLVLGLLAVAASALAPVLAGPLASLAGLCAQCVLWLARGGAAVPGADIAVARPAIPLLLALALAPVAVRAWLDARAPLTGRWSRGLCPRAAAGTAIAAAVAAVVWWWRPGSGPPPWPAVPALTVLAVGQGDAILLRDPAGGAVLVDAGPAGGPPPVLAALARLGVARLDALVVTHAQADHAGGASAVLADLPVGEVVMPPQADSSPVARAVLAGARRYGAAVSRPLAGTEVTVGAWRLRIVSPRRAPVAGEDPNRGAAVIVAEAAGRRALLASDAESDITAPLDIGPVDILKVAHHGSRDDGLPAALGSWRPALALVSVGPNGYGHPDRSTLAALTGAGARVLRTDQAGDLTVRLGGALTVETGR